MAAAATIYFANEATLAVEGQTASNPPSESLAVLKDVEVIAEWEHSELYGFGTTRRVGVCKHTAKCTVKFKYMKYLPTVSGATAWFPMWMADATGATPTGVTVDTNTVRLFKITGVFAPQGSGNSKLQAVVESVYFPKFPLKATENEFVPVEMEGIGTFVTYTNP